MNQEEREMKMIELLHRIEKKLDTLDEITTVLHLGQAASIKDTKKFLLEKFPLGSKVYELCDGKHTVSDIAKSLGKSMPSISQATSNLISEKLITEDKVGNKKYYRRLI